MSAVFRMQCYAGGGGSVTLLVDASAASDSGADGSAASPYKTIAAAVVAANILKAARTTIALAGGTYQAQGFTVDTGGSVRICPASDTASVTVELVGNAGLDMRGYAEIHAVTVKKASAERIGAAVSFWNCWGGGIFGCGVQGFADGSAVQVGYTSQAQIVGCKLENCSVGIRAHMCATAISICNSATGTGTGLYATNNSTIVKIGSQPAGTSKNENTASGGRIIG